jgi:pimeloyl-ACP methyl ester carboxylesterase
MMLDRRVYADQVHSLAPIADVRVAPIDNGDSVEQIADSVLTSAPPRFALAGLSMGGIVAFEIWRRAPYRVSHLGLIDTTPYADRPERQAVRFDQIAAVESGHLKQVLTESMKPLYLAHKNRACSRLLQQILEMGMSLGPDVFKRQSLALAHRPDSVATLPSIDCPSMVICGREDALCPVEFHETMAQAMPRADLLVLAECGHLSVMEDPDAVSDALVHLMRRAT